jgi:iron complex transport system substrate-binding protein
MMFHDSLEELHETALTEDKQMKFRLIIGILTIFLLIGGNIAVFAEETRVVTDMADRQITLPTKGVTFATLGGPLSQLPYVFGAGDQVIAVSEGGNSSLMKELDPNIKNKPVVRTCSSNTNIEELLKANPTAVIAFLTDGQLVEAKSKIPVIYYLSTMSDSFEDMKKQMTVFGNVFENPKAAERYNAYLDRTLALIKDRVGSIPKSERKVVFLGEGQDHLASVGGDTFISKNIMDAAGLTNAVDNIQSAQTKEVGLHKGFAEISMENVIWANPDIILIDVGNPDDILSADQWKSIKAVKNGDVYIRPSGLFTWSRPSAESAVLFPLWLAVKAYPEKFSDISLHDEVKKFYKEIFGVEFSDKSVDGIINGTYADEFLSMN